MMADVYKFRVELNGFENLIWREIEVTSVSSVAKLAYAVLAAFECSGTHLFHIKYAGSRYEILFIEPDSINQSIIDPLQTKLSSLKLNVGHQLTLEYDYGAGWQFSLQLVSIVEMKRGAGTHYPYVTDGMGKGILEDSFPGGLLEIIDQTDRTGITPQIYNEFTGRDEPWDYRAFNLKYCNALYKDDVYMIQNAYEEML